MMWLISLAAAAPECPPLVPESERPPKVASFNAELDASAPSVTELAAVVLDADSYPVDVQLGIWGLGFPALAYSKVLGTCDANGVSSTLVHQVTGSPGFVAARQYVFRMWVESDALGGVFVHWAQVEVPESGAWRGPITDALSAHPDAVLTGYNAGFWWYDGRHLRYEVASTPGGKVPPWLAGMLRPQAVIYPSEVVRRRWGATLSAR